jgi:hypothetical protein
MFTTKEIIVCTNIAQVGLPIVIMERWRKKLVISNQGLQSSMAYIMHACNRETKNAL